MTFVLANIDGSICCSLPLDAANNATRWVLCDSTLVIVGASVVVFIRKAAVGFACMHVPPLQRQQLQCCCAAAQRCRDYHGHTEDEAA